MKVAIVGGGIGGMALALSLHAAGISDVEIYESASAIKELGVGINVLPHAVRELTELGVIDDLASVGIPTAEMVFYSLHGQRIWGEPRGEAARSLLMTSFTTPMISDSPLLSVTLSRRPKTFVPSWNWRMKLSFTTSTSGALVLSRSVKSLPCSNGMFMAAK